jgi:hypothetical protein
MRIFASQESPHQKDAKLSEYGQENQEAENSLCMDSTAQINPQLSSSKILLMELFEDPSAHQGLVLLV